MEHLAFAVEPWAPFREEAAALLPRHWEELAIDKDKLPLEPHWQRYTDLDKAGAVSLVTIRECGRLVGYSIMFVTDSMQHKTALEAWMDIFWVAPEVRGRMGGLRLFRTHEKELRRRGVVRVNVGSRVHRDCSRLFLAMGYRPSERWFSKWLEERAA
jgi:GNAT superfamily N-acetyltransferase